MKKKMSTEAKEFWLVAGILLGLFLIIGIWFLHACRILPYTQRWFISYNSFDKKTDGVAARYPKELPSSAEKVKYFYYTGWLDTKTGISFTLSEEEYQEQKETYLSLYTALEEEHKTNHQEYLDSCLAKYGYIPDWAADEVMYVFDENVTSDFLEEEGLEYLEKIFHDTVDNYTILAYIGVVDGGERCTLEGVFCNDETNEIVIFGFTDVFRKRKQ